MSEITSDSVTYNKGVVLSHRAIGVWFTASLFCCFQFCSQIIMGPMTRQIMEAYDLNALGISYVVSSFFYMYLIIQLPAGIILDRYKTSKVLVMTCFICALGALLMSLANSIPTLIFARMICGLGAGFGFIGTMRILRNYFPMRYIALFIGFTEMLGFLSTAFCENIVSYYLPLVGFKHILLVFGLSGIVVALLIFLTSLKQFSPDYELAPPVKSQNIVADLKLVCLDKQQWILGLTAFCFFSLVTAFAALWGVPILMNIHEYTLSQSASAVSAIFLGIAIGGPLVGLVGLKVKDKVTFMVVCGIICAMIMFVVIEVPMLKVVHSTILLICCGILACCYLMCFTIANEIAPARISGVVMGFINMVVMSSALIMQPVMGYLISMDGAIGMKNGAPLYADIGYNRAGLSIVALFLLASLISTRLNLKPQNTSIQN